jgi:RimJ/RimL family protein N-acetyltransferase
MTILETTRLVLRRLLPSDLDDLYALYRDPEIRRFFPVYPMSRPTEPEPMKRQTRRVVW